MAEALMETSLETITNHCVEECRRQQVGLDRVGLLILGYAFAAENAERIPTEGDVLHLAGVIEPDNGGRYRDLPVTFRDASTVSTAPALIPAAMGRMLDLLDAETNPDEFTKAFLLVHPFSDGNGRMAFVLRNWLKGTLAVPEPLPDYFGDKDQTQGIGR